MKENFTVAKLISTTSEADLFRIAPVPLSATTASRKVSSISRRNPPRVTVFNVV